MRNDVTALRTTAGMCSPIAILVAALGCSRSSPNSPSPPVQSEVSPPPPVPPPPAVSTLYHVTGIVADETSSPIADARVEVDYSGGRGPSDPASFCPGPGSFAFCWLTTATNGTGSYEVAFEPGEGSVFGADGAGLIYSWRDGYDTDIQVLPRGGPEILKNLRLRRARTLHAGQSITVSIEPESALCSDLEDWWILTSRCENLQIVTDQAGTLTIEARARDAGGAVPIVFFATSGRYAGLQLLGPGTVSVRVLAGERYRFFVGIPSGTVPQRYDVSTSLQ